MPKSLTTKFIAIIFAICLLGVGFASGQYYLHRMYQRQVEVGYRRALAEFGTHFQELTTEMGRARLAVSDKQRSLISANLRRLIYAAQSNMGELPLGEIHLERICRLLDRVHEQTYAFVLGELDADSLDQLHGQIEYVSHELDQVLIHKEQEFPWVSWHEYFSTTAVVPEFMQTLTVIDDGLEEFGVPLRRGEIAGESIGREQAIEAARTFSGREDLNFQVINEAKGDIPSYTVEAIDGQVRIAIEVSQRGGMVLWMLVVKDVEESKLSLNEMADRGSDFLEQRGFSSLHITDVQVLKNKATLTFVPNREGILRYGEPLKVQVSAADGSILGFWGTPFFIAQSRTQSKTEPAQEVVWNVQDKVRTGVRILDQKLALIQNEQQEEVLTTRLGVQYREDYYLIYLNAETGDEERIVQVRSPQFF